ncbi:DsrE family protein [Erythrobacter sp.]|uniref:DsrE family protein n=1 Tax=Erythrobacter sp. TaxID=1042 RepID=UPI0025C5C1A1|nr:DsrE family protein [Erythrobacter sp.]
MRIALIALLAVAAPAAAQDMSAFKTGPVLEEFGPHAPVPGVDQLPADAEFQVAFDVSEAAGESGPNRGFMAAARFLNMHVASGVPEENIRLVVVVHGKASLELLSADDNPSRALVEALLAEDVRFVLCGQSAVAYGIASEDLIPGVEMSLSAMTAHAVLQQRGYTVNPF